MTPPGTAAAVEEFVRASLADGRIVRVSADDWDAVAASFPAIERHATGVAGELLIVSTGTALAAVERPTDAERVIRPLADAEAARRFVDERLAQYERMWEGCGCRIDYDA